MVMSLLEEVSRRWAMEKPERPEPPWPLVKDMTAKMKIGWVVGEVDKGNMSQKSKTCRTMSQKIARTF
jgi:hypothetical protein